MQGRRLGPVTREVLRGLIVNGQVRENDMVWTAGMSQWAEAQMVPAVMQAPTPRQQGLVSVEPEYLRLAGFWRRWLAWLIDTSVLGVLSVFVALAIVVALSESKAATDSPIVIIRRPTVTAEMWLVIAVVVLHWLYYAMMEASPYQATLGKLLIGIYVTSEEGREITFSQASVRFAAKLISAALAMVGFLMAAVTLRKQALHDLVAGTLVVRKR
jgi:uncharacterized RDD family membrane protein YckC